jgi:peptidoglycan hydrolase-like protein with peptidoglycan-binding domain
MKKPSKYLLLLLSTFTVQQLAMTENDAKAKDVVEVVDTRNLESRAERVLTRKYRFQENSPRVRELQKQLGNVVVDGKYGNQTRGSHIARLKKLGLPRNNVPPNKPAPRYNISYDKTRRCPDFEAYFRDHGLVPVDVFSYIAWRESRCNPKSINAIWKNGKIVWTLNKDGSYDSGLLQINSSWKTVTSQVCGVEFGNLKELLKLDCNLRVAKFLLKTTSDGLGNWNVRRTN